MRLLILLSLFILVSCEEELTEFSHCTTLEEVSEVGFYAIYLYRLDNLGNQTFLNYHIFNNPFPGTASLDLDDNLNYHFHLESNKVGENGDQSINFIETGQLDFVESEPYSVMQPIGNSDKLKKINYQFRAEDGTSSISRDDRIVDCNQIIFDYEKRINDKDSIRILFVEGF